MPPIIRKYTFRVNEITLEKFRYLADNNFRTVNKELEKVMNDSIAQYEKENGEIKIDLKTR
ncbi:MAG: hypothetical protein KGZ81_05830 [Flavobacteriales bacterium]|nr:hypothetical protein [Flavobacteriales bacterium]